MGEDTLEKDLLKKNPLLKGFLESNNLRYHVSENGELTCKLGEKDLPVSALTGSPEFFGYKQAQEHIFLYESSKLEHSLREAQEPLTGKSVGFLDEAADPKDRVRQQYVQVVARAVQGKNERT